MFFHWVEEADNFNLRDLNMITEMGIAHADISIFVSIICDLSYNVSK